MSARIAIVDDDRNLIASVTIALQAEGFAVESFPDGEAGFRALTGEPFDLAVLDIKMPRMDGMEVLSRLRRESNNMPVIFLTSKDDELDELLGFRMGADDYIRKPFSLRLLVERIRALLRRTAAGAGGAEDAANILRRGDLMLDATRHLCRWKDRPVTLTVTEFLILIALANRPGHVKSRDQLLDAAYSEDVYVDDRTIDSHIKRIRRKFRETDPTFNKIETLYGIGYRFGE